MALGDVLSGIGSLVGAAGSVYGAFQNPQQQYASRPPFTGIISTPQYTLGGGTLVRANNDFLSGQRRLRDIIGRLRGQVAPGFGQLTTTGVAAIRQRAAEAAGGLRAQLARRGLAGASFAQDQLARTNLEYQQAEDQFRAQAFQQEMQAQNDLIDREQASLIAQSQTELQELGLPLSFLDTVNQAAVTQAAIDKQLKAEALLQQIGQPAAMPGTSAIARPISPPVRPKPMTTPKTPRPFPGLK